MRDASPPRAARTRAFEVTVGARQEDLATALLWECGTSGIEVRRAPRGRVSLLAYFSGRAGTGRRLRSRLSRLPGAEVHPVPVPNVDWVARFRDGFRPFAVGAWSVVPAWLAGPGGDRRRLVVEPGRAFGTGTHASTRLCLRALEALAAAAPLGRVVDLGAGTGILAVAAHRLGAASVVAVDIDPEAIDSARLHARLNDAPVRVVQGDLARPLRPRAFDLVVANLTAPLLCHRSDEIAALAAPGARLLLSGALTGNLPALRRAYRAHGRLSSRRDGEWAALVVSQAR